MAAWMLLAVAMTFIAYTGSGAIFGARVSGQNWKSSVGLGALLNTRGLVQLILLNIAYNAHVFSPTLFTVLVVMALATTSITTPILDWLKVPGEEVEEGATL